MTWGKRTICLVTGASQGIGREISLQFSEKMSPDSTLILSARSKEGLAETAALVSKAVPQITTKLFPYDMSKPETNDFKKLFSSYVSEDWDLYMLVHNAGSEGTGRMIKECSDPGEWQNYMSLNLYSMASLTSAFLECFDKNDKTIIINITSLAGVQAIPGMGVYSVGKAAREMYMNSLAKEIPSLKLVNYSPGPVRTAMVDRLITKLSSPDSKAMFEKMEAEDTLVKPEDTVKKLVNVLSPPSLPTIQRVDYFDR